MGRTRHQNMSFGPLISGCIIMELSEQNRNKKIEQEVKMTNHVGLKDMETFGKYFSNS